MITYPVSFMGLQGWQFSSTALTWPGGPTLGVPTNTTGYTLYTGGWSSNITGYTNDPILMPVDFSFNGYSSSNLYSYIWGYLTVGGVASGFYVTPGTDVETGNPWDTWYTCNPSILGNLNSLIDGDPLEDGDTQGMWYQTGSFENKHYVKIIMLCGKSGNTTFPQSYLMNLYRDSISQWLLVRVKGRSGAQTQLRSGGSGAYNSPSVAQTPISLSQVWRGNLSGTSWTYMGIGNVV
jgi:hypothetical protein